MTVKWSKITKKMALDYGTLTHKGDMLLIISALCKKAEDNLNPDHVWAIGDVHYYHDHQAKNGIEGYIPDWSDYGSNFAGEQMACGLRGLENRFSGLCYALTTHDLNSFKIPDIGELITEIRIN